MEISTFQPADKFRRLTELSAEYAAKGEFQEAVRLLNRAMEVKPPNLPIGDEVKALQQRLKAERKASP